MAVERVENYQRLMFGELAGMAADAAFDSQFPENGSFLKVAVKGREYWYYAGYRTGADGGRDARYRKYVGPVGDEAVDGRVERFRTLKHDFRRRRELVDALLGFGFPSPFSGGPIISAIERAGFFRMRGVMVGSLAFQTYSGLLGVKLRENALATADVDFAQFHGISANIDDTIGNMLETLRGVDPTFQPVPHSSGSTLSTRFKSQTFLAEFLTPNRGSDDHQGKPVVMPSLGGAAAEPLRYLDFLIRSPVQSLILFRGGIPVTVPAPERYAVHKLIVAAQRKDGAQGRDKAAKDIRQAALLIEGLGVEGRLADVGHVWVEAWERGPAWKEALSLGRARLPGEVVEQLRSAVIEASIEAGVRPYDSGFDDASPRPR